MTGAADQTGRTVAPHGLHHVTAIADDPQRNVEFYTRVLGLRLVKQTVNFDAPDTYHLYYGDETGRPSSLLTFFPWRGVPRGREGAGLTTATAFSVPEGSIGWWHERLKGLGVPVEQPYSRGGEDVLSLRDPDGMTIELVAAPSDQRSGWDGEASIPAERAVRGLHAITVSEHLLDPTAQMLTTTLGMRLGEEQQNRARFQMSGGESGTLVDVSAVSADRGLQAGGTVHHVAFRAPDLDTMTRWRDELVESGIRVTEIIDRRYFMSIYFREPGGVLFEIATDTPGFDIDEPLLELGRSLKLPPWLEPSREDIEASLPPLRLPGAYG
ncbi:ring-cleaving dioxygenase [Actinobacteria bacterium YIM 96077]|uniref:Ring-cleaving dioxygenase n=1 Tax=Phytoactinopolyspora halophila TaxID=1981511 RepID=A0A329QA01_9ACTN|nr:ring-cleaving dioxygenase [Actinobacteria bacterium YIM 96077]RAW09166.1 ring-cleaving dioxygenase [Phytoactinopolyspora halophila]